MIACKTFLHFQDLSVFLSSELRTFKSLAGHKYAQVFKAFWENDANVKDV